MDVCAVGASAAGKNAATFVMLKNGEIKDLTNTKTPPARVTKAKATPTTKSDEVFAKKAHMSVDTPPVIASHQPVLPTNVTSEVVPSVHIDLQIHISPEASPSQIDAIFADQYAQTVRPHLSHW